VAQGVRDLEVYSHSTDVKQVRLVLVVCGIHGSFENLIYPYYTAYTVGCYHFVIMVDNRSIIIADDIQVAWRYYTLFASAFQAAVFLRTFIHPLRKFSTGGSNRPLSFVGLYVILSVAFQWNAGRCTRGGG
jgi:hypothetical protein